ncbi:uncharacterized protein DNG_10207 [Cephalotrichum gorgonifer]|uniref:Uncharacterized protein n=1 Tax=Cephalotrichum gorgonifer TaxID=2041049 RepID=A0AAE8T044_9PEZI|nr:uncharacterized protein DNG_10207 [Cephalotrichum gorgonifer]
MTPEDVEALLQAPVPSEDGEARSDRRTQLLREVLETLREKWSSEKQSLAPYVEKLAVGSRDDENRERVVKEGGISTIMGFIAMPDLLPYAVAVLYNLMLDYAPAQLEASNLKLSSRLVDLISGPDPSAFQPHLDLVCRILKLLISQEPEPANANPDTPLTLLNLSLDPTVAQDPEDLLSLVSASQDYLSHAPLQAPFIASGGIPAFLTIFEKLHGDAYDPEAFEDPDTSNQVKILRKVLINAIADLTDNPSFASTHPVGSPIFSSLRAWLDSPITSLQAAACLSLGNLSRSDEASLAFVAEHDMHTPLIAALAGTTDTLLLHSALSFLKNLAIPPHNKAILGPPLLAPSVLPRIWGLETLPQVQLASASLTRLLLVGNPSNAQILTSPIPPSTSESHLNGLVSLFERTDDPAKMEAARAILATLRTLASTPDPEALEAHSPYSFEENKAGIASAVTHLLTQTRFPPVRSEALFVLGLLATRSPASVPAVLHLVSSADVLGVFRAAIAGSLPEAEEEPNPLAVSEPRDPKGKEGGVRADRENCLVIVARLVKYLEAESDGGQKGELEDLLREGGVALGKED